MLLHLKGQPPPITHYLPVKSVAEVSKLRKEEQSEKKLAMSPRRLLLPGCVWPSDNVIASVWVAELHVSTSTRASCSANERRVSAVRNAVVNVK